jgi:flagellar hook assembly protein FlgD
MTSLEYVIQAQGFVNVAVYDIQGRLVSVLVDEEQAVGKHTLKWAGLNEDGLGAASGVYLVVLKTTSGTDSRRITLLK